MNTRKSPAFSLVFSRPECRAGIDLGSVNYSTAVAINNAGQSVGYSCVDGVTGALPVVFQDGAVISLGSFQGSSPGNAHGINNVGQIVGASSVNGYTGAFLYSGGSLTNLGDFQGGRGYSSAYDINDATQVVGISVSPNKMDRGFLWQNGVMTDIGDLLGGAGATRAYAINNSGQIVGETLVEVVPSGGSTYPGVSHAILWDDGAMTDLGTLGGLNSQATNINNNGVIIGNSDTLNGQQDPFVYTNNGPMLDLTSIAPFSGWTQLSVNGINDSGQIVGGGIDPSGQEQAFLLTPTPEPSTLALLATGGIGLIVATWRRRQKRPSAQDGTQGRAILPFLHMAASNRK